jgi:hypothetical protein
MKRKVFLLIQLSIKHKKSWATYRQVNETVSLIVQGSKAGEAAEWQAW